MYRVEPQRRVTYPRRDSLRVILAALTSYYDQFVGVLRFELPQLREYMDAVDSPIGPEVQQHDFASQVGKMELPPSGVNPVEIVRKIRRAN
jgi:hypothetical protein